MSLPWLRFDRVHPFHHGIQHLVHHLRVAADILRRGSDAVIVPAEDGGYALIGTRAAQPALFSEMHWSTPGVMAETRCRLERLGLRWQEPLTLWDVDIPADLERLRHSGLAHLIPSPDP